MILLILSFSCIFLFVIYMNYLNKRIDKLEPKIEILQYQIDDVLHDIDVVNRNVIQYCASLKRLEDEKIDAAQNLESRWHDAYEEPQGEYKIICQDECPDFDYFGGGCPGHDIHYYDDNDKEITKEEYEKKGGKK